MNREEVEAAREGIKISRFLDEMVEEERMTPTEEQLVRRAGQAIARAAGHLDANNRPAGGAWEEFCAVTRHENHVEKQKIIELRPELKDDLERFINHRPYHPLPPVVGSLAAPGAALRQYRALIRYIDAKVDEGVITRMESYQMNDPVIAVCYDSGVAYGEMSEQTDKAVVARAYHLMKRKLLELHPELAEELPGRGPSRSR